MKLINLIEAQTPHPDDPEFEKVYHERAFGYETPDLNRVVSEMMTKYPEYVYSGPMYRTIGINMRDFVFTSNKQVLQYINQQIEIRNQDMQSWASTMKGLRKYNKAASRHSGGSHVAVILEQNGKAFNVKQYSIEKGRKSVTRSDGTTSFVNHFAPSAVVDEVLAVPQNSKIYGYMIGTQDFTFKEVRSRFKSRH